ncbi:CYFA0S36e00276g1_1 [Cyberlindnera fabianii]|uniref:CYFA0S36e00276g1_1 n=1 Tax=Cyberlindnera fabianii TaxID=36022 RepID=A0A061BE88_CYBFA|nr:CYFA0S36e00276g1_1 [Cyberlindnera fabianii]
MTEKFDINEFHDKVISEIKEIDELKDISTRQERALELQSEIESVSHLLPTYQQLSYSAKVRTLIDAEQERPKRRFRFSEKAMEARRNKSDVRSRKELVLEDEEEEEEEEVIAKTGEVCVLKDQKCLVKEMTRSVIITDDVCSNVTLKKITKSHIVIKAEGPVFIHDCHGCVLFVECHQLRIHDSSRLKIHAQIPSGRAVIENCKEMMFQGVQVDDFNHPNGGSMNYKLIKFSDPESQRDQIKENPERYISVEIH